MITLLRLLALGLALAGCTPRQLPEQQPETTATCAPSVSHLLLEPDANDLLRSHLQNVVGRNIRQELRKQPMQPMIASPGREVDGDHLNVEISAGADISSALYRIRQLGGDDWAVTQQGDAIVEVRVAPEVVERLKTEALASSLEAVKLRISASDLKTAPAMLAPGRICVDAPGFSAGELDRLAALLTKPGVLTFNLVDEEETSRLSFDPVEWREGEERSGRIALPNDSMDGQLQVIEVDAILTGADVANARQAVDIGDRPNIEFQLHPAGAQRFGRVTTENIGRPFAIVLDSRIVTAPHIQSPITSGSGQITGQFTKDEAEDLAIVLRSGALPAKLRVIERVVAN
jgi:preprotein translocase subunit SecD